MMGKSICFNLFLLAVFMVLASCSDSDMTYKNRFYELKLNGSTGSIKSIRKNDKNLIYSVDCEGPLFTICFRDALKEGEIHEFNALQAGKCRIKVRDEIIALTYSNFEITDLAVVITVKVSESSPRMLWNISIDNNTGFTIDHIDFPNVVVPDDLIGTGGTGRIFWPAQEGCLIEDIRIREESPWLKFKPIEYPTLGWGGFYPSSTQMQYMAYYNEIGGLYLAAHDEKCNPKGIEFHRVSEKGIKLDFRLFPGGTGKGLYTMPYYMVLDVFDGDWYDASGSYRDWRESSGMLVPAKIRDNKMLP